MEGVLRTARLTLVPADPEALRHTFSAGFPAEVSPKWIEQLRTATGPDPWVFGYTAVQTASNTTIGGGSFKGAPGSDGIVEIAYGIDEPYRRQGYATEIAAALVSFAFADARVRVVCAHTFPAAGASPRVLERCGFDRVDDVVDPEDGVVWRFEKRRPT
jgi:[ribosomal protein S5]-alanine N-acetyltransferase